MQAHQSNELVIMDNLAAAMDYADGLDAAETLLSLSSSAPEPEPPTKEVAIQTEAVIQIKASQQTVPLSTQDAGIQVESLSSSLRHENEELKKQVAQLQQKKGVTMIEGNDKLTQTFTGLPSWAMFLHLFMFLSPFTYCQGSTLSTENEMFLVLLKLRLNLIYEDLAQRFGVTVSTVCRIIDRWVDVMYYRLKFLIKWPSPDVVRHNLPPLFQELSPNCICIIDCSEVFIETPHNFSARSATYSNYKKHNTIKFLIGTTPSGSVCFLSKCWRGRVSDKNLTQESRFLRQLLPGDVVMADRGFTIEDDVALYGAKLQIPSFTRGKKQLSQREVELSQQLARVRIHVERIIGLIKNKYTILKGPLPVNVLKHKDDVDISHIDRILTVCAALCNLSQKIV